ncbi:MAG: methylenetetrahydrofolate reductase, partial [Desulfobacterales bacterium]
MTESNLKKILDAGHFAFTGELGPPRGANVAAIMEKAKFLVGNVDSVNITDNQTAMVRMSSWGASLIAMQAGLEPNYQMVCRDRNRLAMQADILGAWAHGIRNMLCLSGDHQQFGDHPQSKGVFDIDSMQLIGMVRKMRDE